MEFQATNQEGLPAYWGIETILAMYNSSQDTTNQEGLPAYWGIETLGEWQICLADPNFHQEGLPAYWGIETI